MTSRRIPIARLPRWARRLPLVAIPLVAASIVLTTILVNRTGTPGVSTARMSSVGQPGQHTPQGVIQHYLYVLPDGGPISVYDMDNAHTLAGTIPVPPQVTFVRGMGADPAGHALYIAYGSVSSHGQLLKLDLLTNRVVYIKTMPKGIDSFDMTPDGKMIYMPDGDGQSDGICRVVDAATGNVVASIDTGGHNPHNTIVSLSGAHVYMGPRLSNYLVEADTATHQIIRRIGPVQNGVRPFTISSKETLAFIETSGFIGFDVANIKSGQILYTVPVPGYTFDPDSTLAPSHGISLSPDERELYLSDWPNSLVHVFDVSGLPAAAPRLITSIRVHNMVGQNTPCVDTNCMKEGWLLHSRDGRFVYVGDAGDVIDTATRQSVAMLPPLANTRKFIEIDWQNGLPIATTSRYGKGYAGDPGVAASLSSPSARHFIYAFVQNNIWVYDLDHTYALDRIITLPAYVHSVRGVSADVAAHALYVSYGSNASHGSLLKYDLLGDRVLYDQTYPSGIDSFALAPDGKKLYMPDGDAAPGNLWRVIDTTTGNVLGTVAGGQCPHNTVTGPSGKYVYLAGRCSPYVYVVDPATDTVVQRIGPFANGGVRPFTVNGSETLVYVTDNDFIGFQVGDIATGKVLFTGSAKGFRCSCASYDAPSHGISLSPDEREVYIPDRFNQYVHVFDVSGLPARAPVPLAHIKLSHPIAGDVPSPCSLDCNREGWVLHSQDGRFVFVGDSGDVIDVATRTVVAYLPALGDCRIYAEIDWQNGVPIFTTTRYGLGRIGVALSH